LWEFIFFTLRLRASIKHFNYRIKIFGIILSPALNENKYKIGIACFKNYLYFKAEITFRSIFVKQKVPENIFKIFQILSS